LVIELGNRLALARTVTSKENSVVKGLRALATDAREIRIRRQTLLDGPHLIESYRRHGGVPEMLVISHSGAMKSEVAAMLASFPDVETLHLTDSLFRDIAGVVTPVGILAVIHTPDAPESPVRGCCVLLDAVQDAGNVGAILRSAAAAGVGEVVLGRGCAGVWTPRVLRAAQGAHFSLRIREQVDLVRIIEEYPGISVATVARNGTSLFKLDLRGEVAWIFGNEGAGIVDELSQRASHLATIPIEADTESLNVGAAAAICLFESVRQRQEGGGNGDGQ
jgi:RNA methyltransferase, TrmH family